MNTDTCSNLFPLNCLDISLIKCESGNGCEGDLQQYQYHVASDIFIFVSNMNNKQKIIALNFEWTGTEFNTDLLSDHVCIGQQSRDAFIANNNYRYVFLNISQGIEYVSASN